MRKTQPIELLALKIEEGGHKPRNVGGFQKLRMSELTGTRKQGAQLDSHRELNSGNNLKEQEIDSPLEPPGKNVVLMNVAQ